MSVTTSATPVLGAVAAPVEALPLPAYPWGAPAAMRALDEVRPLLPVPLRDPAVVSALTTVVLRADGYAVKVYPPGTDAVHLARVLAAVRGSSTVHASVGEPLPTSQGVVTLTPWLPDDRPVSWPELGGLLRTFHAEHRDAALPRWTPLSRMPSQVAGLEPEDALVLLDARAELLAALEHVGSELGDGTIHGDVSEGNAMRTPDGPRLIDLDWVARGPLEYDLSAAARRRRLGEMDRATYATFCAAYGHDVAGWSGLPVLDRVAALGAVVFRLWDDRRHGRPLDWLRGELRGWRVAL